ncbi:MAG TPA: Hsp20/alpha crystallin family protein [Candidatus Limnocylindrales bacterium]|jgi:HSP20 family protein|nr:Hsp20/alpha crystallin family protein [Candidatus Limnocylindrales bacterium]
MTLVRRTSPLGELVSLRQAMDRLFEDSFVRPRAWGFTTDSGPGLPLDITNSTDELVVEAVLPGVKPEDVDVTVEDGTLTISAQSREERQESKGDTLVSEIRRGSVSRTVALPSGLEPDKATATFERGVLRLSIPRAEAVKPRQIRITPTIDGQSTNGAQVEAGASKKS